MFFSFFDLQREEKKHILRTRSSVLPFVHQGVVTNFMFGIGCQLVTISIAHGGETLLLRIMWPRLADSQALLQCCVRV